jgi:hypothetical protein
MTEHRFSRAHLGQRKRGELGELVPSTSAGVDVLKTTSALNPKLLKILRKIPTEIRYRR